MEDLFWIGKLWDLIWRLNELHQRHTPTDFKIEQLQAICYIKTRTASLSYILSLWQKFCIWKDWCVLTLFKHFKAFTKYKMAEGSCNNYLKLNQILSLSTNQFRKEMGGRIREEREKMKKESRCIMYKYQLPSKNVNIMYYKYALVNAR